MPVSQCPASSLLSTGPRLCPLTAGQSGFLRAPGVHQGDQLALGSGEVRGQERSVLCRFFLPLTLPGPWPAAIQPSGPLKVRGEVGGTGGRHRWKAPGVRGHL